MDVLEGATALATLASCPRACLLLGFFLFIGWEKSTSVQVLYVSRAASSRSGNINMLFGSRTQGGPAWRFAIPSDLSLFWFSRTLRALWLS